MLAECSGCCSGLHRVLLAEDDKLNRKVTLCMLERLGYRTDTVSNGIEVLRALENNSYGLVLMNIGLPLMDGLEATRRIRKRWLNFPKIIALTAYASPDAREICLQAGMDDCIIKPTRVKELASVLRRHLE